MDSLSCTYRPVLGKYVIVTFASAFCFYLLLVACQGIAIFATSSSSVYAFGSVTCRAELILNGVFVASAIMIMFKDGVNRL
jgi:hypothetical protein